MNKHSDSENWLCILHSQLWVSDYSEGGVMSYGIIIGGGADCSFTNITIREHEGYGFVTRKPISKWVKNYIKRERYGL